jgi:hypothetical protein
MSRHSCFLAACVAALLVLLAVSAVADVPRCAEDGSRLEAAAFPAAVRGTLTYNGVSGCAEGESATFEIVDRDAPSSTIAKLNDWSYIVVVRNAAPAVYTLDAKCNSEVVCQAQIAVVAKSN